MLRFLVVFNLSSFFSSSCTPHLAYIPVGTDLASVSCESQAALCATRTSSRTEKKSGESQAWGKAELLFISNLVHRYIHARSGGKGRRPSYNTIPASPLSFAAFVSQTRSVHPGTICATLFARVCVSCGWPEFGFVNRKPLSSPRPPLGDDCCSLLLRCFRPWSAAVSCLIAFAVCLLSLSLPRTETYQPPT